MPTRKIIERLRLEGWVKKNQSGSHAHYTHPEKKGKVTVPHPKKDIPKKTYQNICKQAGWK